MTVGSELEVHRMEVMFYMSVLQAGSSYCVSKVT